MLLLFVGVYVCLTGFSLQNKDSRDHTPKKKGNTLPAARPELWPAREDPGSCPACALGSRPREVAGGVHQTPSLCGEALGPHHPRCR